MRIFKYWATASRVLHIDDFTQESTVYGGSDISIEHAREDAEQRLDKAAAKIQEKINRVFNNDPSYEVDIREEIIEKIDSNNIITRNRYGAQVLNSTDTMFIDVDSYKLSFMKIFFRRGKTNKDFMLAGIEKAAAKSVYSQLGFRIYETYKGYRVLVSGFHYPVRSIETKSILKDFNGDRLYNYMCEKQNCYRARLTPKPNRVEQKLPRIIFPDRTYEQQNVLDKWLDEYRYKSQRYSTCNLVKEIGFISSTRVIEYHDRISKVNSNFPLA
ncbi:hypothetical protein [Nonlabens sp. Asnod2-A12]|uniref:hypothetical protein n=1 Tax=Nonlabens sp. Asnod2-A12 TaxID=3160578 RepID=UPI00386BC0A7